MTAPPEVDGGAAAWFDELTEGIVLIDDGRVVRMNAAASKHLGVDRRKALGLPPIAVLRDHRLERAYLERREAEVGVRGRTLRIRPITGGVALHDVTDLRRSERDARDLLAVLSHELRTPATTIQGTLDALDLDLAPARRDRLLARARIESARLVRLLGDLTAEAQPPRARSVWLPDMVERTLALLEPAASARNVRIRTGALDATVWIDPDKLLQVLLNLVENAVMHGPADADVTIRAEDAAGGPGVAVVVRDEGSPLDPSTVEELFAPHRRGAGSDGSGLGLYIVRSIATRAGGSAWARPLPDGNEFGVELPRPPRHVGGGGSPSVAGSETSAGGRAPSALSGNRRP